MSNSDFYGGQDQPWTITFDMADAAQSTFELLDKGILRIGDVETRINPLKLPWEMDDKVSPSWRLRFLSLKWLSPLMDDCSASSTRDNARTVLLSTVLRGWIDWERHAADAAKTDHWHGHATALRATNLVGASSSLRAPWLRASIERHGEYLAQSSNWSGHWNHGLMESIALLACGMRLNRDDFSDLARQRITESIKVMVDEQGCINEQATGYAPFVYYLLDRVSNAFEHNQIPLSDLNIAERKERLASFIAHATDPTGHIVQLGDTFREPPQTPANSEAERSLAQALVQRPERNKVAIYERGFIFGRSGWSSGGPGSGGDESFYSIRFGAQRLIHGHNDHMSVTLFDGGRDVIIDSGHNGYQDGPYRRHLRSVEAHNVLRIQGKRHDWSSNTTLGRRDIRADHQFFELEDTAFDGITRNRSILAGAKSPMLICDRVKTNQKQETFDQIWHLASDLQLVSAEDGHAVFRATDDSTTHLISYIFDSKTGVERPPINYWRGSTAPHQGWSSKRNLSNTPTPALSFLARTADLFLLTCIVPNIMSETLKPSLRKGPRGWLVLRIQAPENRWEWNVARSGLLEPRSSVDN